MYLDKKIESVDEAIEQSKIEIEIMDKMNEEMGVLLEKLSRKEVDMRLKETYYPFSDHFDNQIAKLNELESIMKIMQEDQSGQYGDFDDEAISTFELLSVKARESFSMQHRLWNDYRFYLDMGFFPPEGNDDKFDEDGNLKEELQ